MYEFFSVSNQDQTVVQLVVVRHIDVEELIHFDRACRVGKSSFQEEQEEPHHSLTRILSVTNTTKLCQ